MVSEDRTVANLGVGNVKTRRGLRGDLWVLGMFHVLIRMLLTWVSL